MRIQCILSRVATEGLRGNGVKFCLPWGELPRLNYHTISEYESFLLLCVVIHMAADSNSPSQIVRAWLGGIRGGCPYRWFMSCSQSRGTPKVKRRRWMTSDVILISCWTSRRSSVGCTGHSMDDRGGATYWGYATEWVGPRRSHHVNHTRSFRSCSTTYDSLIYPCIYRVVTEHYPRLCNHGYTANRLLPEKPVRAVHKFPKTEMQKRCNWAYWV